MLAKYSNGWGHLAMSLAVIGMVTLLLLTKSLDQTACVTILSVVITFWFASGVVNRFNGSPPVTGTTGNNSPLPSITPPQQQGPQPIILGNSTNNPVHGG